MAPSVDCCAASLLCCEESGCLSNDGEQEREECRLPVYCVSSPSWPLTEVQETSDTEAAIYALVEREISHLPRPDYAEKYQSKLLDGGCRQHAISWIFKVGAFFNFGPLTAVLSVNYLDRFLSCHKLPSGKAWMMQLLSVACLSVAAKMEEVEVPFLLDLQVRPECFFESRTIQRMELLVLSTLEWQMSSVTPFAYIEYFIRKFDLNGSLRSIALSRIIELILLSIQDLRFLPYRPTSIAAAAVLCTVQELLPPQRTDFRKILLSMIPMQLHDPSDRCFLLMSDTFLSSVHRLLKDENFSIAVPCSPIGVLDASFSCESESALKSTESDPSVQISSPASKKRKMEDFSSNVKVCVS